MRKFDTEDLVVIRKQMELIRKDRISQKLVLKTKGSYIFLERVTPIPYWLQSFPLF